MYVFVVAYATGCGVYCAVSFAVTLFSLINCIQFSILDFVRINVLMYGHVQGAFKKFVDRHVNYEITLIIFCHFST